MNRRSRSSRIFSQGPSCVPQLEQKTGVPKEKIKEILENIREKGTIGKRGSRYCLLPLLPGIFEKYFIRLNDTEENLKKAAEIYRFLFKNFVPQFLNETNFKLFRPLLPVEAEEKLIEVDESFDVESKVLSYELIKSHRENLINIYLPNLFK